MSRDGVELKIRGSVFKTDLLELFSNVAKTLAQAFVAVKTGGFSLKLTPNAVSGLFGILKSIKRDDTLEVRAWILVSGGVLYAVEKVLEDLVSSNNKIEPEILERFSSDLAERISSKTYSIEPVFFSAPNRLRLLDDVAHELSVVVESLGGKENHTVLRTQLEKYFPSGLHRTWMKDASRFEPLESALESPFAKSLKFANECDGYRQYVEEEFTQIRLIGQDEDDPDAVNLAQVFVPLRAYIEKGSGKDAAITLSEPIQSSESMESKLRETKKRDVIRLFETLDNWIAAPKKRDWLRVISGGPGIGKSSSMRAFAAKTAKENKAYPIVIPLQKLEKPLSGLRERIGHYLVSNKDIPFTTPPLESEERLHDTTVIIFDGLDELVRPGRDADEIARDFMVDLQRFLEEENGLRGNTTPRFLAIVTGRIGASTTAAKALKCSPEQVFFLLPFSVKDNQDFSDPQQLLKEDQRATWWDLWKAAAKNVPVKMPKELLSNDLFEVTREPLLLYFIAYVRPWETAANEGGFDRNSLYAQLLHSFYRRECDKGDRNFATEFEDFDSYEVVLQAMALAAWYDGSTRTGTIDIVFKLLRFWDEEIERAFQNVVSSTKPAAGAALAFYMKPGERPNSFEFLHKTFAEYLVARRMVETVRYLNDVYYDWHETQKRRRTFDESTHLLEWLRFFGPREIDADLLKFLRAEFALLHKKNEPQVNAYQNTLAFFLQACVKNRMPAHLLFTLPDEKYVKRPQTFADAADQERNAEIGLLACLNAAIIPNLNRKPFKAVDIRPASRSGLSQFINRIRGYRIGPNNLGLSLLAGIDMSSEVFHVQDFYGFDGRRTNLEGSQFTYGVLAEANLEGANLRNAIFASANMSSATLDEANCEGAHFQFTNLRSIGALKTCFRNADLEDADLSQAELSGADFSGAKLVGVNFEDATQKDAKITGKQLKTIKVTPKIQKLPARKVRKKT